MVRKEEESICEVGRLKNALVDTIMQYSGISELMTFWDSHVVLRKEIVLNWKVQNVLKL